MFRYPNIFSVNLYFLFSGKVNLFKKKKTKIRLKLPLFLSSRSTSRWLLWKRGVFAMYKISLLKRHFLSRTRKLNYRERLVETAANKYYKGCFFQRKLFVETLH